MHIIIFIQFPVTDYIFLQSFCTIQIGSQLKNNQEDFQTVLDHEVNTNVGRIRMNPITLIFL